MIYIASPFTHESIAVMHERYEKVAKLCATYILLGDHVYSPIVHCRPIANYIREKTNWEFWRHFDLHMLSLATDLWVYELDGWKESVGVQAEIQFAEENNIPVSYIGE